MASSTHSVAVAVALLLLLASGAGASVTMTLLLEPDTTCQGSRKLGPAPTIAESAEFGVLAWSWGASSDKNKDVQQQDLSITKFLNEYTDDLVQMLNSHACFKATLTNKPTQAGSPTSVLTATGCEMTSFSTGGSNGEDRLTENISFKFTSFSLDVTESAPV